MDVPAATRSEKMRAGKSRKKNVISIYSQYLKAEDVQLLEFNCFRSDYCRQVGIFRE